MRRWAARSCPAARLRELQYPFPWRRWSGIERSLSAHGLVPASPHKSEACHRLRLLLKHKDKVKGSGMAFARRSCHRKDGQCLQHGLPPVERCAEQNEEKQRLWDERGDRKRFHWWAGMRWPEAI
jgi:hypothetical protein